MVNYRGNPLSPNYTRFTWSKCGGCGKLYPKFRNYKFRGQPVKNYNFKQEPEPCVECNSLRFCYHWKDIPTKVLVNFVLAWPFLREMISVLQEEEMKNNGAND